MKPLDPNFTPNRIAEQVAAFKRNGGQIQLIPFGTMKENASIGGRQHLDTVAARVFEAREEELTMKKVRQNWKSRSASKQ